MDRIDAMKVFVTALDEGSLAGAGRKLGRSAAAVSRAIAFLEACVGAELLHRTTRSIKTSSVGEQYAAACRRVLTDLEEAEMIAAGERSAPRGTLMLTAPELPGEAVLRPILDAFMDAFPAVSARLHLTDRYMKLVDEGVDVALRIGHLRDSALIAIRVGEVRRVLAAAPNYLARRPRIVQPSDLTGHQIVAASQFGLDSWNFPPSPGSRVPRTVHFSPRLVVNSVRAAVASAAAGAGITRVFSCQVAEHVRAGELEMLLTDAEEPPVPVHVLAPTGRLAVPKARAFVDFVTPRLRSYFAGLAMVAGETPSYSRHGNVVTPAQVMVRPELPPARLHLWQTAGMRPDSVSVPPPRDQRFPPGHSMLPGALNQRELATVA